MKWVISSLIAVITVVFLCQDTQAEENGYLPGLALLTKMERLLQAATPAKLPTGEMRSVQAGRPYQDGGIVASFVTGLGGAFWILEEWKLETDGNFRITYTQMWERKAVRWEKKCTPSGTFLAVGAREEELDITSADTVSKSRRAQELLYEHGRPIFFGGEET